MHTTYTDIHSHILPGVDDGAPNMETAMEMLSIGYSQGIRQQFLTPHYIPGNNQYQPEDLERIYEELKQKAEKEFPDLQLYLGNELYYTPGVAEHIRRKQVHTMAGSRYVLVEFAENASYREIYEAMKELSKMRVFPVIAHVERYQSLVKHEDRLAELMEMDVYLQLNAGGVPGGRFDRKAGWKRQLLKNGLISFLGTDAHDTVYRKPQMREAVDWIRQKIPESRADQMLWDNAQAIIHNTYIENR